MVVTGLGITFSPGLYVRSVLARDTSLKALELQGRSVYRTIGMLWRKSTARHASCERLARLFRDTIPTEGTSE
jgi:LysR family hydrogen peroxide-inducible transcriptional activator